MKIRLKILSGFMIIATMLVVSGYWSILGFRGIGHSVNAILDENYESIRASQSMIESLEREDSGILLLLLGQWEQGRQEIHTSDSTFRSLLDFTFSNITVPGEREALETVEQVYSEYSALIKRPIVGTDHENNLDWYQSTVHPTFMNVKEALINLTLLNNDELYSTSSRLQARAEQAVLPGILAIISAFILTALFNYLIHVFMVNPILEMIAGVRDFHARKEFRVQILTRDELQTLAEEIRKLTHQLRPRN